MWWSCLTPKLVRVHHRGAPIQRCPNTCVLPAAHAKVLGAASAQASNGEPLAAPAIIAGIKNYVRATEGGAMRAAQSPHHAGRHARGTRGGGGGNGAGKSSLAASMWRSVLEQGMQPSSPMPAPPRPGSGARTPTHSRSTPTFGSGRTGPQIQRRNNPAASMVRPCRARRVLWLAPHSCNCVAPCCSPRHLRLLSHPHRRLLPYQPYVAVCRRVWPWHSRCSHLLAARGAVASAAGTVAYLNVQPTPGGPAQAAPALCRYGRSACRPCVPGISHPVRPRSQDAVPLPPAHVHRGNHG